MALGLNDLKAAKRPKKQEQAPAPAPVPLAENTAVPQARPQRPWEGDEELITRTARAQLAVHKAREISERNELQAREFLSRAPSSIPTLEVAAAALVGQEAKRRGLFQQIRDFFIDS